MEMYIGKMTQEDVEQVAVIEEENFSIPWSYQSFMDALDKPENIYVVARVDGMVAGYIGSWSVFNEVNITNVCVNKDFRQQGIGQAMMQFLMEEGLAKGYDTFFLEVRVSNVPAIRLYEKMGFKNIGVRKNLYEKPTEDGIVMSYIHLTN